ncbi:MAG: glycosyltransferase family 4 protein [Candidatus Roizmanbacteria bacterium]|nr:glycosyltransferase family 4 protein [Candidatus Roizmanbacteria bacterium]
MKNLEKLLTTKARAIRVIYVSSYIPRYCGIATYTKDLTNAINLLNPYALAEIMATTRPKERINYPWEVKYKIEQDNLSTYLRAAEYINQSGANIVCLEHEFGLFGGNNGEYILPFIESLKIPLVTTLHTVVANATSGEGEILKRLIKKSVAVTVMLEKVKVKLVENYGTPGEKVVTISHGTPDLPYSQTTAYKKKRNLSGRLILGNINLLTPSRGIEYSLEAVALIAKKYPNVLYVVIGQTHPVYVRTNGESYRNFLKKKVKKLSIDRNVRFINEYLSLEELINWLKTIDFYVTVYLGPEQAASGSLAYAVGGGKCCISTPYLYAREILADGRGVLVPFRDSQAIASAVIDLWDNPDKKNSMEKKAYQYGRLMTWPNVAFQYLELFRTVLETNVLNHKYD